MSELSPAALEEIREVAVRAALTGGELLRERFERGGERAIASKSTPTDLLSEADLLSQQAIRELLGELRPLDGFLGEEDEAGEGAGVGGAPGERVPGAGPAVQASGAAGQSELRWVVDPLDGTVNFLFGIPQWCVSVAAQDAAGRTVAGAIFDPCRRELWAARRGAGATLNGEPISGSERRELASAMLATGFYYEATVRAAQARVLRELIPRVRDIRRFGAAALDLAWTAAGRYDAYFERGVKVWDVAAGALICECAGLHRRELAARQDLPAGVLVATEGLLEPLLELVG